jgi:hypothetical protein
MGTNQICGIVNAGDFSYVGASPARLRRDWGKKRRAGSLEDMGQQSGSQVTANGGMVLGGPCGKTAKHLFV